MKEIMQDFALWICLVTIILLVLDAIDRGIHK